MKDAKNAKRYNPDPNIGLTDAEVSARIEDGLVHHNANVKTKTHRQIVAGNLFTLFNILNFGLALAILLCGAYKNLLFVGTAIMNTIIATVQEIKAKHIIDKLSLINESKATVIRNTKEKVVDQEELLLDDVMLLRLGDQIIVDSIIIDGECQVNESFITGEDKPIDKKTGDMILSGSFLISGICKAKVEHIGDDNYTSTISKDAKYIKKVNSEILNSLNKVIRMISFIIIPLGLLLFLNQLSLDGNTFNEAVISTCAALIGMIPEGLILLTSAVIAVSVIRLSRYKVLVQELYCIETLSRVDVLCLDKTGTITEGKMEICDLICENGIEKEEVNKILSSLCWTLNDISPTMKAIKDKYQNSSGKAFNAKKVNLFSSETKYSSVVLDNVTYYLGAPDFIMKDKKDYKEYEKDYRVILLAKEEKGKKTALAIILIQDKIRAEAKDTLAYFKERGVDIKIISGDNPVTVSGIAKRVGLENYQKYVDFSKIKNKKEMEKAIEENVIFGRVKPNQKKDLILLFKSLGHTVAMTGDGVNDVLALKEADCGIAMASGSDAARSVSQLVLLDSNFASMPKVVEEGRRTINNIQRSASLFLTKTIYTILISITLIFFALNYPFLPIHLSLMNLITIALPAFVLALEPNHDIIKGNFLVNVILKALPTALTFYLTAIIMMILGDRLNLDSVVISTMAVILCTIIMFTLQFTICRPFNTIRRILFGTVIAIFLVELIFFRDFFSLTNLNNISAVLLAVIILSTFTLLKIFNSLIAYFMSPRKKKKAPLEA